LAGYGFRVNKIFEKWNGVRRRFITLRREKLEGF
jgi:hypothetical protein